MTTIDRLVIEVGLDPRQMSQGSREAIESLRRLEQQSLSQAKQVESNQKRSIDLMSNLRREVLGVTAMFLGGRGIKEFIGYVTNMDAAIGRVSYTLGMASGQVSAWEGALSQIGAPAGSATSALQGLSGEVQRFLQTGQMSQGLAVFSQMSGGIYDSAGKIKDAGKMWLEVADWLDKSGMDPQQKAARLSFLPGMNEGMINMLVKGRVAVEDYLRVAKEAGGTTEKSAAVAQEYQRALSLLDRSATDLGRTFTTAVTPALVAAMDAMRRWITAQNDPEQFQKTVAERKRTGGGISVWDRMASRAFGMPVVDPESGERRQYHLGRPGYTVVGQTAPAAAAAPAGGIPIKPGAGVASPAVQKILEALAGVPGISRATAMNDPYHALLGGGHPAGRAVDVTVKDPRTAAEVAQRVRAALADKGIAANVLDEYNFPSKNSTGGHLHIGIDPATANRLGGASIGARGAAAGGGLQGGRDLSGGVANTITIGQMNINAPNATDAGGISKEIAAQLSLAITAGEFNNGQN